MFTEWNYFHDTEYKFNPTKSKANDVPLHKTHFDFCISFALFFYPISDDDLYPYLFIYVIFSFMLNYTK